MKEVIIKSLKLSSITPSTLLFNHAYQALSTGTLNEGNSTFHIFKNTTDTRSFTTTGDLDLAEPV